MKWASRAKSRIASSSWTRAKSSKTRSRPISSAAPAAIARKNSCPRFSRIRHGGLSFAPTRSLAMTEVCFFAHGGLKFVDQALTISRIQGGTAASQPNRRIRLDRIAYVNGSFVPLADAKVSVLDRGFLFADGIYEVAAVLDGKLIDNASHLARLERSVGEISLALPETVERIQEIQKELVARNSLVDGMVYLEVTRGADTGRDFAFPKSGVKPTLVMFTSVKDIVNAESAKTGIKVITVPDIRWTRRAIKSVALLAQVLAKQAAAEAGAGEAWMIEDGKITEGGSSSAFILTQDDVLVTRQNGSAILPGCTRKAVVALAEERQLRVEERAFSVEQALAAKEAFITSATVFGQAVVMIDGKKVANGKPGPMTDRLREIYVEFAKATAL